MVIRALKFNDISALVSIAKASMPHPWNEVAFRDCLKPNYSSWVLLVNDELIGFIIILQHESEGELMNLAIKPEYQRKGYAKLLLQHAIDFMKSKGVARLLLEVRRSNHVAIQFYKKMGGQQIGLRKNYYPLGKQREDALIFSLNV